MTHQNTQQQRLIKKLEQAIDKLIDIQDMGFGDSEITRALEILNEKLGRVS